MTIRKTAATGLALATFAAGIAATATPATARGYHPYHLGWGFGGVAAGLALGAVAAAASAPDYGTHCLASQPIIDTYGNIIGYRRVRVC